MNLKKKMNSSYDALNHASQTESKTREIKDIDFIKVSLQMKSSRKNLDR
jgi:hypothetical protein